MWRNCEDYISEGGCIQTKQGASGKPNFSLLDFSFQRSLQFKPPVLWFLIFDCGKLIQPFPHNTIVLIDDPIYK